MESMRPELIIGLVGPIGCDIASVETAISNALKKLDYKVASISLSKGIADLLQIVEGKRPRLETLQEKIDAGNKIRQLRENNRILAAYAMFRIRELRVEMSKKDGRTIHKDAEPEDVRLDGVAFIVRQFKRPEEIQLMKMVYGSAFVLISVTQRRQELTNNLKLRIGRERPTSHPSELESQAAQLILQDENEDQNEFGQRLASTFHLADFFVSAVDRISVEQTTSRFFNALFGRNDIAPSKDEFGSYLAKTASLRSVDLSRQVGAAILSPDGDLIAVGCNEVPKPGGGNYWDEDMGKKRDIDVGGEANKEEKNRIIHDFLNTLIKNNILKDGSTAESILSDGNLRCAIDGSLIGDITEYGRMVHAEMNAIMDAARLGRSIKGATLYVTTFPCHSCAKHIIASGISRVVFIEPYPKSKTERLLNDFVTINDEHEGKVHFSHFSGISPSRFLSIFEKLEKRVGSDGSILEWNRGQRRPRIGEQVADYTSSETLAIDENLPK